MIQNEGGVLTIIDGSETVYNSSTDKLMHNLLPRIDNSISRSSADWSGSSAWTSREADFSIGSLPSVSTDIVGLCRVTYSGGITHLPSGGWYVAGGSFLLLAKDFQSLSGTWANYICSMAAITIYKDGDDLRFREQIRLKDHYMAGPNLNLSGYTLAYRLFPAVFS